MIRNIVMTISVIIFLVLASVFPENANAQDLDCEVIINMDQISSANTDYLKKLKPDIETYLNEYEWTDDRFMEQERIKCTLQFDLTSIDDNANITGSLVISTRRPIYGTTQQTQVIQLRDNSWVINYPINKTLVHDLQLFDSLTSLLDYYAFIILGYDYDTFSLEGGTPFYEKALKIVDLAQSTSSTGWNRNSGTNRDNRFFLVSHLLRSNYDGLRTFYYRYHRHALDIFTTDPEGARREIFAQLENLEDVQNNTTDLFLFRQLFDSKYQEMISIFSNAKPSLRLNAHELLVELDQSHIGSYNRELLN